jgi:hypothetical protein
MIVTGFVMPRVYCETLPFEEVVRPRVLALLARYRLELVLAVRPWDAPTLPDVARALRDHGIPLSIWPMLADEQGRWANANNAAAFGRFLAETCDALEGAGAPPRDVLLDLEPPFERVQSFTRLAAVGMRELRDPVTRSHFGFGTRSPSLAEAGALLADAVAHVADRGISTSLAVWPMVALDPAGASPWQALLGTPVDALGAAHVSVMMYTSMMEGWSRGVLRRRDALALLAAATVRTARRWRARAGISLGCVGTGAFHDEPIYRGPSELAEDVAVAQAAGCERLSLFDLGGVVRREPSEAWLEAFTAGEGGGVVATSKRVWAVRAIASVATRLLRRGDA